MKTLRKSLYLPDMVREGEETSAVDTMDDGTILEVVWVAETREHMYLVWKPLFTLVTGLLWLSKLIYKQHHDNSNILQENDWFVRRMMLQFENKREPIRR